MPTTRRLPLPMCRWRPAGPRRHPGPSRPVVDYCQVMTTVEATAQPGTSPRRERLRPPRAARKRPTAGGGSDRQMPRGEYVFRCGATPSACTAVLRSQSTPSASQGRQTRCAGKPIHHRTRLPRSAALCWSDTSVNYSTSPRGTWRHFREPRVTSRRRKRSPCARQRRATDACRRSVGKSSLCMGWVNRGTARRARVNQLGLYNSADRRGVDDDNDDVIAGRSVSLWSRVRRLERRS